jgi:hypothetical protein
MISTDSNAKAWRISRAFAIMPAERLMLALITCIGISAVVITQVMHRQVNWPPFLVGFAATLALVAIGAYIRKVKAAPRIALAVIGVGLFMGFTAVSTVFIFSLFPLPNPLMDPWLIGIDANLGYHWPSFVAKLANFPGIAVALGYLYHSSLPQIVLTIILLAALARDKALHQFLLVGILSMILAVGIWWVWPSIGPSGFQTIPEDIRISTGLYFDSEYGAYLRNLVEVGPGRISPEVLTGVVAFPSYHMIMACMVVWFTRGTLLFIPAIAANTAMVPATLSHGGHHLVDLLAGVAVFALCVLITNRLLRTSCEAG